jgi:hypothetical protein
MAQRHLHSSWTGSLTPSSSDLQAGCTLQALISATTLQASLVLFASPPLMSFFTTTFIFNGMPWKANHHNGSFQLPSKFWTFSQLCPKTIKCLLQSLQRYFGKDSIQITPPHLQTFGPQKSQLPLNFFFSNHQVNSDKYPRKGASATGWKIRA